MESSRNGRWLRWSGALVLLALLAALSWPGADAPPTGAADPAPRDEAPIRDEPVAQVVREHGVVVGATDEPAPVELGPDADLSHPFAFELDVRVMDRFTLPVPDAMVFVAPRACGFSLWPERTGPHGTLRLEWRGRVRAMEVQVAVLAWGVLQPLRQVRCEAGVTAHVAVAVRGRKQSDDVVATQRELAKKPAYERSSDNWERRREMMRERSRAGKLQRNDELDILCGRTQLLFQSVFLCTDCHQPGRVQQYSMLARAGAMSPSLHPFSAFHDLRVRKLDPNDEAARREAAEASAREGEGEGGDRARRGRAQGRVVGVVRDSDGAPAADVPVAWLGAGGVVARQVRTRPDGKYVIEGLPLGTVELQAGGGSVGLASGVVMTAPNAATTWDCVLAQSSVVRGRAADADDLSLSGWRVELVRDEGDWASWATTDRDGWFGFFGVPGTAQCLLWPRDEGGALPIVHGLAALVDGAPVRLALRHDNPTRGRLRIRPLLPEGYEHLDVDARLLQLDTGFVAQFEPFPFETALELELLPPGSYRLQVGAPGLGWVESSLLVLDGRGLWDCGGVRLPTPGRVRVRTVGGVASPFDGAYGFYRRTDAVDVRVAATRDGDGDAWTLPRDDYVLVWRDEQGDVRARSFRVESGQLTELVVGPR